MSVCVCLCMCLCVRVSDLFYFIHLLSNETYSTQFNSRLCPSTTGSSPPLGTSNVFLSFAIPVRTVQREVPGSNPASAGIFSGSSHTSDLKIGTPVATLPGAWRYRVSTGTGRPGVSIL